MYVIVVTTNYSPVKGSWEKFPGYNTDSDWTYNT